MRPRLPSTPCARAPTSPPAQPTCGLALAESERVMPKVLDRFECELDALGLANEPITLRMTGCPNGCARPYTADIAFVGRRPDEYHIYIGGGLTGDRMADLYAADAHTDELVELLRPLLQKCLFLTTAFPIRRVVTNRNQAIIADNKIEARSRVSENTVSVGSCGSHSASIESEIAVFSTR